jgi:hypothetical protein
MIKKEYSGLPPALLLPARDYVFSEEAKIISIVLPREGKYSDIDPTFNDNFGTKDEKFSVVRTTKNNTEMIYMSEISRLMFAKKIYPELQDHQAFIIAAIEIKSKEVVVHGKIISILTKDIGNGPTTTV